MKWFKHMSDASSDEFIVELEELFGLEGVARWWKLVEAVAANVDPKKDEWSLCYPWSKWQTLLRGKRKKLETFLEHSQNKQKTKLKRNGNFLEIEIPTLRELCDNYTKDLQAYVKPTPKQEEEEEEEEKGEKTKDKSSAFTNAGQTANKPDSTFYITKKKRKLAGKRLDAFEQFWTAFSYKRGKADAADAWLDIPELTQSLVETICQQAALEAARRPMLQVKGKTPIMAQGWITGRRWEDDLQEIGQTTGNAKTDQNILVAQRWAEGKAI